MKFIIEFDCALVGSNKLPGGGLQYIMGGGIEITLFSKGIAIEFTPFFRESGNGFRPTLLN